MTSKKDFSQPNSVGGLFKVQLFLMACAGQTPSVLDEHFSTSLKGVGRLLMRLYSVFIVSQTGHTTVLYVKTTFDKLQHGELDEITDALTQVIVFGFACFSSSYWLYHSRVLSDFIELIKREHWHQSLVGITYVNSYPAYLKTRRFVLYWFGIALLGSVFWGLPPMLQGIHTLPHRCWYPFDPLAHGIYPLMYSYQMFAQINIGLAFSTGSALYVTLIIFIIAQFDVLFCSLKNLQYHAALISGEDLDEMRYLQAHFASSLNEEVNQYLLAEEELTNFQQFENIFEQRCYKTSLRESLKKCVELHRFIVHCCNILEDLFYPFCLVKSLQITVQLCLLVFVVVEGETSLMRIFTIFQYLGLTLTELCMYCFYGELLKQHSTRSGEALFRSQWHVYAPLVRKDILIFLANSKRAVELTAGKLFVMDLERLRSVVMQAFSFLTLLQNLADKKKIGK